MEQNENRKRRTVWDAKMEIIIDLEETMKPRSANKQENENNS